MDTDRKNIEKPSDRVVFSLSPLVPHGARENFRRDSVVDFNRVHPCASVVGNNYEY
jgi:hypothetical protein